MRGQGGTLDVLLGEPYRACELLLNPILTVGEVASSVEYEDQLLFSKIFKRTLAVSPREYRQSRLAGQSPAPY